MKGCFDRVINNRIRIHLQAAIATTSRIVHTSHIDTMADPSGPKKTAIPQWQQQKSSKAPEPSDQQPTDQEIPIPTSAPSRATLLDQASKFLEEDEVKDAPAERKKAFLETKGLTQEEIHRLLNLPTDTANAEGQGSRIKQDVRFSSLRW